MPIRVLDAQTISRIAAGEVVERPASIVKEMIENAIDAGATSITVEIRDGGISYIRITDNGCGIPASETRFAFTNHATSKISNGDSLTDIATLGFRGEALSSVAAVAKVEMRTRTRDADSGVIVKVEGGSWLGMSEIGCPEGTSITVRDLFYNVPARKAFLRRPQYESGAIYDTIIRQMFGNPGVSMRLLNNGKTVAHSFGDGDLRNVALAVFGRDTAQALEEVDIFEGTFRMRGLVGMGDLSRKNRSAQLFFINNRSVRCSLLTYVLEQATRERVGIGMHPLCALHITVPPASVDVNVHPSKLEIRFRDEEAFRQTAQALLDTALRKKTLLDLPNLVQEKEKSAALEEASPTPTPVVDMTASEKLTRAKELLSREEDQKQADAAYYASLRSSILSMAGRHTVRSHSSSAYEEWSRKQDSALSAPPPEELSVPSSQPASPSAPDVEQMPMEPFAQEKTPSPKYRIIGVAMRTYLILETESALILIDQHAAHERILFEEYKKRVGAGTASQRLLTPILLPLSPKDIALIEENQTAVREAGYEIAPFGEREVRIDAVPFVIGKADTSLLLAEMVDTLSELKNAQMQERLQSILKLSCRKAIKAGDTLSDAEVRALVEEMLTSDAPPTCPHGRPVARAITRTELEKMFWRT